MSIIFSHLETHWFTNFLELSYTLLASLAGARNTRLQLGRKVYWEMSFSSPADLLLRWRYHLEKAQQHIDRPILQRPYSLFSSSSSSSFSSNFSNSFILAIQTGPLWLYFGSNSKYTFIYFYFYTYIKIYVKGLVFSIYDFL